MPLTLRTPTLDDVQAIAVVHVFAWLRTYRGLVPDEVLEQYTLWKREDQWHSHLIDPDNPMRHQLAERDGVVIGFVAWGPGRGEARPELVALYVRPDHWRTGVGRTLMVAAEASLAQLGNEAFLWVLSENGPARRFYEDTGWTPDGGSRWQDFGDKPLLMIRYARRFVS
ncbi:MAG: GNAT superfamily N-acetyltransferase [Myxococcota bacterium]